MYIRSLSHWQTIKYKILVLFQGKLKLGSAAARLLLSQYGLCVGGATDVLVEVD